MWFLRTIIQTHGLQRNQTKQHYEKLTQQDHSNRICIYQATFFGHIKQREEQKHLLTTGMIKGKCSRGKQQGKIMDELTKWLKAGIDAPKATRDRDDWNVVISTLKSRVHE